MNSMDGLRITNLTVIDAPVNQIGNRLLAVFDMNIVGVNIHGCVLIEDSDGMAIAKGPRGKTHKGDPVVVTFGDPALQRQVTKRAATIYGEFTGRAVEIE